MAYYQLIKDNIFSIAIFCFIAILLFIVESWLTIQEPVIKESSLLPKIPQYLGNDSNVGKQASTSELTVLYAKYDKEAIVEAVEDDGTSIGMDKEQQLLQQGNLAQLFIGENKYQLIGTFSTINKNSALLIVINVTTGMVGAIEIKLHEKIDGWQVATIAKNSIEFVNNQRSVTLQIFKRINAE